MPSTKLRVRAVAALAAVAVIALAGCSSTASSGSQSGATGKLTPVSFVMNFTPGGAQVGFTYAKQLGLYQKAGLDVTIKPGTGSIPAAQQVAAGKVDIGYTDAPSAFSVAGTGGDIKIVAPVLQVNGFAVMWLKGSGINAIQDLAGKKIGLQAGTGNAELFKAVLAKNGVQYSSIKPVNVAPAALQASLLGKQVDAIVSGGDTQVPLLQLAGHDIGYKMFYQVGVPTVGLSITASSSYLAAHAAIVKKFTEASLQGWADAKKHPSAAAASMVTQFPTAGSNAQITAELKVDLGLLCASDGATKLGPVSDAAWSQTGDLLKQTGLLKQSANVSDLIAQKYAGTTFPSC
ncbi:MAG TPA: ABC transporter substrate-binding protein [Galbitalea sp.]